MKILAFVLSLLFLQSCVVKNACGPGYKVVSPKKYFKSKRKRHFQ